MKRNTAAAISSGLTFLTVSLMLLPAKHETKAVHVKPNKPKAVLVKPNVTLKEKAKAAVLVKPKINWGDYNIEQIKSFEAFKAHPYICPAGVRTVGYGHTGKFAKQTVTKERADAILRDELNEAKETVRKHVKVKLTPWQLESLASFTFNCGERNLKTLVNGTDRLNSGNYESVERVMPLYVKANKKTLRGLVIRREMEVNLWRGKTNQTIASNE